MCRHSVEFLFSRPLHGPTKATNPTLSAHNVGMLPRIAIQDHLLVEYRPIILVPSTSSEWEGMINPYTHRQGGCNDYYVSSCLT